MLKRKWSVLFKWEYILLNVFLFAVMYILYGLFNFSVNFFDPVHRQMADGSVFDLYFAKVRPVNTVHDRQIVIVTILNADREKLTSVVRSVDSSGAKVIGLDIILKEFHGTKTDTLLKEAFDRARGKMVFDYDAFKKEGTAKEFGAQKLGHVNLSTLSEYGVVRDVDLYVDSIPAFALSIYDKYHNGDVSHLRLDKAGVYPINYYGNNRLFKQLYFDTSFIEGLDLQRTFKNKIVIISALNSSDPIRSLEDKHYTPMNPYIASHSPPDMHGAIVQANILHMLLNNDIITKVPNWVSYLLAFIVSLCLTPFIIYFYLSGSYWSYPVSKFVQLVIVIVTVLLSFYMLHLTNIMIDPEPISLAVLFLVDVVFLYDALVNILSRYFKLNSVFVSNE